MFIYILSDFIMFVPSSVWVQVQVHVQVIQLACFGSVQTDSGALVIDPVHEFKAVTDCDPDHGSTCPIIQITESWDQNRPDLSEGLVSERTNPTKVIYRFLNFENFHFVVKIIRISSWKFLHVVSLNFLQSSDVCKITELIQKWRVSSWSAQINNTDL